MTSWRIFLVVICLATSVVSARAQSAQPTARTDQGQQLPTLIAPYDSKLMRLSEVLGSVHYLRELCQADEGQLWRDKMTALLEAEKPDSIRKSRMIARFNRGYGAFDRNYRTCTPAALLAVKRYVQEGITLASQISSRYGR